MLKVENLSCGYDEKDVVKNVSFSVKENERLCILGPNGCGKTTLLRAVAGLLKSNGTIKIIDKNIKDYKRKDLSKQIGVMNQVSSIYFSYSVYETVMLGRYSHYKGGIFQSESKADIDFVLECMKKTGVYDLKDKLITELSGGQLQRVFLARLFAQDPSIILLDEPTNHLDLKYQLELMEYLKEWSMQEGKCIVGVLHDISLALNFADKILLLKDGETMDYKETSNIDMEIFNKIYGMDIKKYMLSSLSIWQK